MYHYISCCYNNNSISVFKIRLTTWYLSLTFMGNTCNQNTLLRFDVFKWYATVSCIFISQKFHGLCLISSNIMN